jgi:hypothetical protein
VLVVAGLERDVVGERLPGLGAGREAVQVVVLLRSEMGTASRRADESASASSGLPVDVVNPVDLFGIGLDGRQV